MSTLPCCRKGSRLAETVSVYLIWSGLKPSCAATIFAISMSKPSGSFDPAETFPSPGWSFFTPMVISPASFAAFQVFESAMSALSLTLYSGASALAPSPSAGASGVPPWPQPLSASIPMATEATASLSFFMVSPCE